MISFTHNPSKSASHHHYEYEQEYQPMVITNAGSGKQQQMPEPARSKKMLVKAHSNSRSNNSIKRTEKPINQKKSTTAFENVPWNSQAGTQTVLYDNYLKKDTLAAEERKLRAEQRVKQNGKHKERGHSGSILAKQEEIQRKKIEVVTKEQQKQIIKLRQMIEKERAEKQKNDMEYEERKRKIEAERRQLMELEKQIQKQGPKVMKQVKQKIKGIEPGFDRVRLKETLNQQNPKNEIKARTYENYAEVTQSQSIANQKNIIRQQQLDYLVGQRQRNYQQYQKNTLGYTPTLIPLLSRASYKIISTHISSLVELFIDDLLEQQVYLLQAIELEAKAEKQKQNQKEMLSDYVRKLQNFVDETEQIEDKLGKYSQMKFEQIYKFPSKTGQLNKTSQSFKYQPELFMKLQLRLNNDEVQEIEHRVDRFKRYVSSFDEYKRENLDMFNKVTEEIINEAIHKLAKELDEGAGEFVNIVFRSQFQ